MIIDNDLQTVIHENKLNVCIACMSAKFQEPFLFLFSEIQLLVLSSE